MHVYQSSKWRSWCSTMLLMPPSADINLERSRSVVVNEVESTARNRFGRRREWRKSSRYVAAPKQ